MICGVVLVKSVEIVFTLKQFCFSFLDETAVPHHMPKGRIEQGQHLYSVIIEVGNPDD